MKKSLERSKWPFEVSMSLKGICPEILQPPRKQITSNQRGKEEERKRKKTREIFCFTVSSTHFINSENPKAVNICSSAPASETQGKSQVRGH